MIGSLKRRKFWILFPFAFIFNVLMGYVAHYIVAYMYYRPIAFFLSIIPLFISSLLLYYLFVARLHDIGKSGTWVFVLFILNVTFARNPITSIWPILYMLFLLYWCSKPSRNQEK